MEREILLILEIVGTVLFILCISEYCARPISRNSFLFGSKSKLGALLFCCVFTFGLILTFSLCCNHICCLKITPSDLVNWENTKQSNTQVDGFFAIISQFADPGNIPSARGSSRWLAMVLAFLGVFCLSGLLISSLVRYFNQKSDRWRQGHIHYEHGLRKDKYTVIIGVNELTAGIVKHSLRSHKKDNVLIQTRQDVGKMRERLDLSLDDDEEKRVVYYYGELTSQQDVNALHPEKCREIYILGEDLDFEDEKDHDSYNINCVELIKDIIKEKNLKNKGKKKQLKCHVNFEYQGTFTAFKATHHYLELKKDIVFVPFNVHDIWAKKVLVDNYAVIPGKNKGELDVQRYLPIDSYKDKEQKIQYITKDNIGENAKSVHVVIMGMNQMGTAFGMQTALMAHYPNFKFDRNLRTTITFIDEHAKAEGEFLRSRFEALFGLCRYRVVRCDKGEELKAITEKIDWIDPLDPTYKSGMFGHLSEESQTNKGDYNFMDLQWEFVQGNVASKDVSDYLRDLSSDQSKTVTIAICFNDPQKSIATALYLPGQVVRQSNQVIVYQQNSFGLIDKVAKGEKDWRRYRNMFPFGMTDGSYTGDELENSTAKIQNYIFAHRDQVDSLENFNNSLIPRINDCWEELGTILRQSNIDMAESIQSKIRSMGLQYKGNPNDIAKIFEDDEEIIDTMAYSEHLRWVTQKLIGGFRPLHKLEASEFDEKQQDDEYFRKKDSYKRKNRAHLDICSNERLRILDPRAPQNDRNVIKDIPLLLRCTEWINMKEYRQDPSRKNSIIDGLRFIPENIPVDYKFEDEDVMLRHSRWMGESPISRQQWFEVTGKKEPGKGKGNYPVVDVSKNDIEDFLLILHKRTGLYFALPSIKEWAYVAKLSTKYLDECADWSKPLCYRTSDDSSINDDALRKNKQSRKYQKNNLGIYDMLGNVWEWTREEVKGHKNCFYFCGGSYRFNKLECDMRKEYWYTYWAPTLASPDLSFRLVWKADVKESIFKKCIRQDSKRDMALEWLKKRENWVKIGGGYFIMGAYNTKNKLALADCIDDLAESDEGPMHFVRLDSFEICSVPVTQELWNNVEGRDYKGNDSSNIGSDKPQTNVSYKTSSADKEDIVGFIDKLNRLDSDYTYRLPTEAEWEYAAKGGHDSNMARAIEGLVESRKKSGSKLLDDKDMLDLLNHKDKTGKYDYRYKKYAGSDIAQEVAWYNEESTQPVAKKKPVYIADPENGVIQKLYDMSGNIWEWIEDKYKVSYYEDCMSEDEYVKYGYKSNPVCTDPAYSAHVFRGGSYLFDERECRCTRPNYWVDSDSDVDLGFRLVRIKKSDTDKQ